MSLSSSRSSTSGELWGFPLMPNKIVVDVLLPNGIFVTVETCRECDLLDLKKKVWQAALDQPLFSLLSDQSSYIFVGVTKDGECEEFYNEDRRLCDLHLFTPVVKVVEAKGNREEKILNLNITQAIGISVDELNKIECAQVKTFRKSVAQACKNFCESDQSASHSNPHQHIQRCFPPRVDSSPLLPVYALKNLINGSHVVVRVWMASDDSFETNMTISVLPESTPKEIIRKVIRKRSRAISSKPTTPEVSCDDYVLKVSGLNEYLEGNYPIAQYTFVRHCINQNHPPDLVLQNTKHVVENLTDFTNQVHLPLVVNHNQEKYKNPYQSSVLTSSIKKPFRVCVVSGCYLSVSDNLNVYVSIYHGMNELCKCSKTSVLNGSGAPKWNEWLTWDDMAICNLPVGAKLCIGIGGMKRKKDGHWPLAWANVPLFDHKGYLLQGKRTFRLWPALCDQEEFLYPLGVCGSNPCCVETPSIELEFDHFGKAAVHSTVSTEAENHSSHDDDDDAYADLSPSYNLDTFSRSSLYQASTKVVEAKPGKQFIYEIVAKDSLYCLSKTEKAALWTLRRQCLNIPYSLPKLLQAVKWSNAEVVQEMYCLLKIWKPVPPDIALELLSCKYPDPIVRRFAISALTTITDDELLKYLLQLVFALRFELHLDSMLLRFLLLRAVSNVRIGHYMFWYLKSAMQDPHVTMQFGLFLETFCRLCGGQLSHLVKQTELVDKLVNVNTFLKEEGASSAKLLKDQLMKPDYEEVLSNILSPLDPRIPLSHLCYDKCEIKSPTRKSLLLHWESTDMQINHAPNSHGILFKTGEDLRPDMIAVQIMHVMDDIWQKCGLDLCLSQYSCSSMGDKVGMIELVDQAETVMAIQRKGGGVVGSLQLRSNTLHQWIKDNNPTSIQYQQAVNNFVRSCAGHCIATMVLGVADRHSDNILIKKNGLMCMIDFGHILTQKKKKYSICRNRVPFVLPQDFMRIICPGSTCDFTKTDDYKHFEELCCQAFLSIRAKANVILSLLSMMLGAGVPELSSFDDLQYVRNALALGNTESEAVQHFKSYLVAAHSKQWTTKVDWVCLAMRHSVRR